MQKIKNIEIKNFKSIQEASFEASDVNIFIGEPNTGKSNILEAIAFTNLENYYKIDLNKLFRFKYLNNLFYNSEGRREIDVKVEENNDTGFKFTYKLRNHGINITLKKNNETLIDNLLLISKDSKLIFNGKAVSSEKKFYRFELNNSEFISSSNTSLNYPFGENLPEVIINNPELKEYFGQLIAGNNKKLGYREETSELEELLSIDDFIIKSVPWQGFSDGMKNYMYNLAALESNNNSIILLEEPESHYFPYYSKIFGEKIKNNPSNQYFIATHNPYFLSTVLEKIPENKLKVFLVYFDKLESKLIEIPNNYLIDFDFDIFLNIEKIREEIEAK